jgi:prophage regulatory protein
MQDRTELIQLVHALARLAAESDYQELLPDDRQRDGSQGLKVHSSQVDRYLRRSEVERLTGLSRSSIYRHISTGVFPRPFALTARSVRWRESEIIAWMARHIRTST